MSEAVKSPSGTNRRSCFSISNSSIHIAIIPTNIVSIEQPNLEVHTADKRPSI